MSQVLTRMAETGIFSRRWLGTLDFRQFRSTLHHRPREGEHALNRINDEEQLRLFQAGSEPIIYCITNRAASFPVDSFSQDSSAKRCQPSERIYIASKITHASKWRDLRDDGWPIISTWIDEAGEGQSKSLGDLTDRCIAEAISCTHFILYSEPGEILKGALLECGAALANAVPVFCVGDGPSISRVFEHHPCWHMCDTIEDALTRSTKSQTRSGGAAPFSLDARFSLA